VIPLSLALPKHVVSFLLSHGLPLGLSALATAWLLQGPIVVFRHVNPDPTAVGQLGLTLQALTILVGLAWSLAAASLPVLSRSVAREDGKDRKFVSVLSRAGWLAGAAIAMAGLAVGPRLVITIFGESYADAGQLLGPVLALFGPLFIGLSGATVLVAHGRRISTLGHSAAAAIALWALTPFLTQIFGAHGVIHSAALAYSLWAITQLIELRSLTHLSLSRTILRPVFAGGLALFAYWTTAANLGPGFGLVAGVLVLGLLSIMCLSAVERRALLAWRPSSLRSG
jgi:O-antigen/teichoic acid export membrane protein